MSIETIASMKYDWEGPETNPFVHFLIQFNIQAFQINLVIEVDKETVLEINKAQNISAKENFLFVKQPLIYEISGQDTPKLYDFLCYSWP